MKSQRTKQMSLKSRDTMYCPELGNWQHKCTFVPSTPNLQDCPFIDDAPRWVLNERHLSSMSTKRSSIGRACGAFPNSEQMLRTDLRPR
jgi:hypothetical protein